MRKLIGVFTLATGVFSLFDSLKLIKTGADNIKKPKPSVTPPYNNFDNVVNLSPSTLNDLYEKYGAKWGVDPLLLKSIATVESNENPQAVNPNDPSFGLCQILCQFDEEGYCKNRFPAVNGWEGTHKSDLLKPDKNLDVAAQILTWNIKAYGLERGVAVYNSWSSRDGEIKNPEYVEKVFKVYRRLNDAVS